MNSEKCPTGKVVLSWTAWCNSGACFYWQIIYGVSFRKVKKKLKKEGWKRLSGRWYCPICTQKMKEE